MPRRKADTHGCAPQDQQKPATWRVALYIRLSKEDGNDESESVVNQKKILADYMEKEFGDPYAVVDYYIDDGLSGTDDRRANFMRLIKDIEDGHVNCMVCKTLSRAFRNYADQGYYLEDYFSQRNTRFITLGDPKIDTFKNPDAVSGLEVPITGLLNDRYAAKTSHDVRRTFRMKRERGEFIGAFPPYGFLKDPENRNRLILDPEIVPIKHDMKRWVLLEGMSLLAVAKRLNELGIPNPTVYKRRKGWNYNSPHMKDQKGLWLAKSVKEVLLNPANIGHMVQGKQKVISYKVHDKVSVEKSDWFIVESMIDPTFSEDEYDALVRMLSRDTRTVTTGRTVHLFSGFLRCADCGMAMHRKTNGTKAGVYYACRTYAEKSKNACTRHSISERLLEKAVLASIQYHIFYLKGLSEFLESANYAAAALAQTDWVDRSIADNGRELEKKRSLFDGLYEDLKGGVISEEVYRRLSEKYQRQADELLQIIKNLEVERARLASGVARQSEVFETFRKHKNITALDRMILNDFIDTIYVHEGKALTIKFRFSDQVGQILAFVEQNAEGAK